MGKIEAIWSQTNQNPMGFDLFVTFLPLGEQTIEAPGGASIVCSPLLSASSSTLLGKAHFFPKTTNQNRECFDLLSYPQELKGP
ncbi:MAG: hypothetical protein M3014_07515 [Chloroflexota bacterium]|nr:hypothetical protein [Chloroflexota bacterium]